MTAHFFFDKKLQVYLRPGSRVWQCSASVGGHRFRSSTKHEEFASAKVVAEDWYLGLRGKLASGILTPKEKVLTFADAAAEYMREVSVLTISNRSPKYIEGMALRLKVHILPYFGKSPIKEVNKGLIKSYCVKRYEDTIAKSGKPPARNTMLHEIVHIRQILKFAEGRGWIDYVPTIDTEFLRKTKRGRRAWFSQEEYKQLYTATRNRVANGKRPGWAEPYEDLHDYVLFMANTGLRPDEAKHLEIRDVSIVEDFATKQKILEIDVRGKVGTGYAKSTNGAVHPYSRLWERRLKALEKKHPEADAKAIERLLATTKVFPKFPRDLFKKVLDEEQLRFDRDGQRRTAYSLRHTYISSRLMEGANIYQIANNCRTSVEMIEKHYAAHIKDRIDAAAINVMRPKAVREASKRGRQQAAVRQTVSDKSLDNNDPPAT